MKFDSPLRLIELGNSHHWQPGTGDWATVQAVIDRGEPVQVIQEAGSTRWQTELPEGHSLYFGFPDFPPDPALPTPPAPRARIWISPMQRRFAQSSDFPKVQWHPQVLWVGIGYNRSISSAQIETAIREVCQAFHLAVAAIAGLATLNHKLTSPELLEQCHHRGWQLQGFAAEQLRLYPANAASETASEKVAAYIGTASVAEAAAMLAAQQATEQVLLTHSIAQAPRLRVRKQIVRFADPAGAVTVAIAEAGSD